MASPSVTPAFSAERLAKGVGAAAEDPEPVDQAGHARGKNPNDSDFWQGADSYTWRGSRYGVSG